MPKKVYLHINGIKKAITLHAEHDPNGYGPKTNSGHVQHGDLKNVLKWGSIDGRLKKGMVYGISKPTSLSNLCKELGVYPTQNRKKKAPPQPVKLTEKTQNNNGFSKQDFPPLTPDPKAPIPVFKESFSLPKNGIFCTQHELIEAVALYHMETGCRPRRSGEDGEDEILYGMLADKNGPNLTCSALHQCIEQGHVEGVPKGTTLKDFLKQPEPLRKMVLFMNPAYFIDANDARSINAQFIFLHVGLKMKDDDDLFDDKTEIGGWRVRDLRTVFEQGKVHNFDGIEGLRPTPISYDLFIKFSKVALNTHEKIREHERTHGVSRPSALTIAAPTHLDVA